MAEQRNVIILSFLWVLFIVGLEIFLGRYHQELTHIDSLHTITFMHFFGVILSGIGIAIMAGWGYVSNQKLLRKLRVSKERYRLLVDNIQDTVWSTDLDFKLTCVNRNVKNLLGYEVTEFLGLNATDITLPEGMIIIQKAAQDLLTGYHQRKEDKQIIFEVKQTKKDGTIIDVEITATLLFDKAENLVGFQGRSINIAERRKRYYGKRSTDIQEEN